MKLFLTMLLTFAALAAHGSQEARAQAQDTTHVAGPVRLVPVKILSPGGVRIRSVRDNRRIVILSPPARVSLLPPAQVSPAPAVGTTRGTTWDDLNRLEIRLQEYFDARTRDLELAWRESIQSLSAGLTGAAGPAGPRGPSGATQVVVIPLAAPATAAADSALADTALVSLPNSYVADSTREPAPAAAPDTTGPFVGIKAPRMVTLLPPGASSADIERAVLEGELLRAVNIIFEFNSAALLPASLSMLNSIGSVLAKHPELRMEIDGHTDSSGPAEYNLRLSQARAETVRDYLVATFSIDRERLHARGFGEDMPVASEDTPTGRALNRRVEFLVLRPGERLDAPSLRPEEKRP